MLLTAFAVPSYANVIQTATGTVTCSSDSLEFKGIDLNAADSYSVHFSFTLTPMSGTPFTITDVVPIALGTGGSFDVTSTGPLGPFTQAERITSATATLFRFGAAENTVAIMFTSTFISCGGSGSCPATFGFWKHHAFPTVVQTSGLNIGGVTYSATKLLAILDNPGGGNAIHILGPQLVAALLNKAAGAVDNSTADGAIITAEDLLSAHSLNLLTSFVALRRHLARH
jgi:hypothetical protein